MIRNCLSKQIPQDAQRDDVAIQMLKQTTYYSSLLFPAIAINESCSRFRVHTRLQKSTWMILKIHRDYHLPNDSYWTATLPRPNLEFNTTTFPYVSVLYPYTLLSLSLKKGGNVMPEQHEGRSEKSKTVSFK